MVEKENARPHIELVFRPGENHKAFVTSVVFDMESRCMFVQLVRQMKVL